jgi:hypothetical protein
MYGNMPKYVCKHAKVYMQTCERMYIKMRSSKPPSITPRLVRMQTCGNMGSGHACRNMRRGHLETWALGIYAEMFGSTLSAPSLPPHKHPLSASMCANIRSAHHALPPLNACMHEDRIGSLRISHSRILPSPHHCLHQALENK